MSEDLENILIKDEGSKVMFIIKYKEASLEFIELINIQKSI